MMYLILLLLASILAASEAHADNFKSARYNPQRNQLVVVMVYSGTNPNHTFHLNWGECRPLDQERGMWQVAADVLDDQWNDAAFKEYSRTLKFDLSKQPCRPARVTLKTAPRFYYTLTIPADTNSTAGNQIIRPANPPICPRGFVHRAGSMCVPTTVQSGRVGSLGGAHSAHATDGPEPLTVRPGLEIAIFGRCGYHVPAETTPTTDGTNVRGPGCAKR